jgi:hypothetical protein
MALEGRDDRLGTACADHFEVGVEIAVPAAAASFLPGRTLSPDDAERSGGEAAAVCSGRIHCPPQGEDVSGVTP